MDAAPLNLTWERTGDHSDPDHKTLGANELNPSIISLPNVMVFIDLRVGQVICYGSSTEQI